MSHSEMKVKVLKCWKTTGQICPILAKKGPYPLDWRRSVHGNVIPKNSKNADIYGSFYFYFIFFSNIVDSAVLLRKKRDIYIYILVKTTHICQHLKKNLDLHFHVLMFSNPGDKVLFIASMGQICPVVFQHFMTFTFISECDI